MSLSWEVYADIVRRPSTNGMKAARRIVRLENIILHEADDHTQSLVGDYADPEQLCTCEVCEEARKILKRRRRVKK